MATTTTTVDSLRSVSPSSECSAATGTTATTTATEPPEAIMRLNSSILSSLAEKGVSVPTFDRSKIRPGILHVGVGNFHRAHMAAYVNDMMTADFEAAKSWGIIGCGTMPKFDQPKRDLLQEQEWLQTVVVADSVHHKAQVLGCMTDFLPIDTVSIEKSLQNPDIRIVSMTVTEGGYFLKDGQFDLDHDMVQHDIANPDSPKTIFGVLCKAARYRKDHGLPLFTVLSCDNIPHNGNVARKAVISLAKAQDENFADWVFNNVGFPNSMVDRITPATTDDQKQFIKTNYGYEDAQPIFCEPWRQWILEDTFSSPGGKPPLDMLENVKFVPDVTPYEFMKLRILNGGHASLCYPSAVLDIDFVHDSMAHPTISAFLDVLERNEIIPTVPPVPDIELKEYWDTISIRFSNPTLRDKIGRNCYDGLSRQPQFITPAIRDNLKAGRPVDGMALVSAMWSRYCQGTTESGEDILPNDPQWDRLQELALKAKADPSVWLENLPEVYGSDIDPVFEKAFGESLREVNEKGVEEAMKSYIRRFEQ